MTQSPEEHPGLDAQLDRLLDPAVDPQDLSGDLPRLAALLAAAAAPSDAGPQPGETVVLDAFRELVTEAAGTPSLVRRHSVRGHRRRAIVIASASTVAMLASGVAAAATGSLPGAAQQTAKTVLGTLGVHVPGPNAHAGNHPNERGKSSDAPTPHPSTPGGPPATLPSPHATPPTPGNSGPSRHHGNPTPASTAHPAPHHGKPTARPVSVSTHHATPRVAHVHPNATPYRVMRGSNRPISH